MKRLFILAAMLLSSVAYAMSGTELIEQARKCIRLSPAAVPKQWVNELLEQVAERKYVSELGGDDLQIKYLDLQCCMERTISRLPEPVTAIIHMATLPSQLCTVPEPIDPDLIEPSLRQNPEMIYTLRCRAASVRDFLASGHTLYCVYPKAGLQKRTPQQQATYKAIAERYPRRFFDLQLKTDRLQPEMNGTTYFFFLEDGLWVFSIASHQFGDPQGQSQWTVWFGPIVNPSVNERVSQLFGYLTPLGLKRPANTQ
jgi:hypothetical protein